MANRWKKSERVPIITIGKGLNARRDDELTAMNAFIYFIGKIEPAKQDESARRALRFLTDKFSDMKGNNQ